MPEPRFVPALDLPDSPGPAITVVVHPSGVAVLDRHPDEVAGGAARQVLGLLDGVSCWAVDLDGDGVPDVVVEQVGGELVPLHGLHGRVDDARWTLAGRAVQLVEWDRTHRFCGRCGTATEPAPGERARRCPACGLLAFPRLAPAVITLVTRGEEALLARGRLFPVPMYSCIAGFVEPGETLEEAVHREVREEVGVALADVAYTASQPWPFPHSLMVGFEATWESGEIEIDGDEIVDADWYRADALPAIPPPCRSPAPSSTAGSSAWAERPPPVHPRDGRHRIYDPLRAARGAGPWRGDTVRSRRAITAVALATLLALTAGACGSGRSTGSGGGGDTETSTAATSSEATFGTLESPCGEGDAAGATDKGVTDTEIQLGYGDDAGYQSSPGLNHQMSDAMKAFISWCNDQGGINGRTIKGNYHDAKILDVNNAMIDACSTDFFLVGQGFSLDASQEETRRGCGLPSVAGYAVSPQFANAPLKWEPFPIPADYTNAAAALYFQQEHPEKTSKIASMYANYSATIDSKDKVESAWTNLGYQFLPCPQQYNIQGESDWKPFVQKLKDCGAEIVYFVGSPYPNFENALTAADQIGFEPIWYVDANFYDENFKNWNATGFADNVYLRESYTPLEEASDNPATQQYLDVMRTYGGDVNQLGEQSASAFLLWATAAKACGADLTRQCVGDELDKITSWDGGGLHAEANPGENLPSECGLVLKLQGTSYVRVSPSEPNTYTCDPKIAAAVTGPALERAKLDANRVAQLG